MSTIFEKIVSREIPAHILYEDDQVISFLDISQATMGHTLICPKKAYQNIFEMPDDLLSHLMMVAKKLSIAIEKAFSISGLNLLSNNGQLAGQTVFHFHLHLIPRYKENDVTFKFENHMNDLTFDEYQKRARLIKEALS